MAVPDPTPIRGRLVFNICTECGGQIRPDGMCGYGCPFDMEPHPESKVERVEYVPVPDEQAIERAARLLPMFHPADAREMTREILAAALEPEAP